MGTGAGGAGLKSSATVPVVIILTVVRYGGGVLALSTTSDPHYALPKTDPLPPKLLAFPHSI